ncbi:hypothetical protein TNCV_2750931 [Trichonephila clavipes]|nr:hypothetical protein TNCV_2750931 [Trichonephila clavipes]
MFKKSWQTLTTTNSVNKLPKEEAEEAVEEIGPTSTLLVVEDDDELAKSDVVAEFNADAFWSSVSLESLITPHSTK